MKMSNTEKHQFARRLRAARYTAGMSIRDLAEAVHVRHASVLAWEAGIKAPLPTRLAALAEALAVNPFWLLLGEAGGARGANVA